jgi:hypothetical protein
MDKKIIKKQGKFFTQEEQHSIIQEMITNGLSRKAIWRKYTGQQEEHGQLLRWMKKLGYPIVGRVCMSAVNAAIQIHPYWFERQIKFPNPLVLFLLIPSLF